MGGAGLHQDVEEPGLERCGHPQLEAQVAGEGDSANEGVDHADVESSDVEEAERLAGHVVVGQVAEDVPGAGPGDRQAGQFVAERLVRHGAVVGEE